MTVVLLNFWEIKTAQRLKSLLCFFLPGFDPSQNDDCIRLYGLCNKVSKTDKIQFERLLSHTCGSQKSETRKLIPLFIYEGVCVSYLFLVTCSCLSRFKHCPHCMCLSPCPVFLWIKKQLLLVMVTPNGPSLVSSSAENQFLINSLSY